MNHPATRREVIALGLAAALPGLSQAQGAPAAYPNKPIRLVLGVPPGGSVDTLARVVAQQLGTAMGVPVIVENKPGASNKIATDFVAKSAPDGYTLLSIGSSAPVTEAAAIATGGERLFDTLRDFTPVGTIAGNTYALAVSPTLGVANVSEFIAFAKSKPGFVNYGSAGVAKTDHVAAELFSQGTGIKMTHVPFKGIAEAINQMLAGNIHCCFSALAPMSAHIRAGKLRLLGVVSSERSQLFPDAPTLAEAVPLPGYAVEAWIGIVAPARTPPAVVNKLNAEFARMLKDEAFVKNMLLPNGLEPFLKSPAEMGAMFRGELERYITLFKTIGVKLDS
jgi:tripartite-type tricarboxylate transporter receptor subunit TctC